MSREELILDVREFNQNKREISSSYQQQITNFENSLKESISKLENNFPTDGTSGEYVKNIKNETESLLGILKSLLTSLSTYDISGMSLGVEFETKEEPV